MKTRSNLLSAPPIEQAPGAGRQTAELNFHCRNIIENTKSLKIKYMVIHWIKVSKSNRSDCPMESKFTRATNLSHSRVNQPYNSIHITPTCIHRTRDSPRCGRLPRRPSGHSPRSSRRARRARAASLGTSWDRLSHSVEQIETA